MQWQLSPVETNKLKTLSDIGFLPQSDVAKMLGRHKATIYRYARILKNTIAEFSHIDGEGGYSGADIQLMLLYSHLRSQKMGQKRAIATISRALMAYDSVDELTQSLTNQEK